MLCFRRRIRCYSSNSISPMVCRLKLCSQIFKRIDQMPIEKLLSAAREAEKDWIDLGDEENAALIKSLADKVDELAVENQDQMRMLESQDRSLLKAYRELEKIGRQLAVLDECTSSDSARIA